MLHKGTPRMGGRPGAPLVVPRAKVHGTTVGGSGAEDGQREVGRSHLLLVPTQVGDGYEI